MDRSDGHSSMAGHRHMPIVINDGDDDDDAQLQEALALSLKEHQPAPSPSLQRSQLQRQVRYSNNNEDDDDDLKRALALSLQDNGMVAAAAPLSPIFRHEDDESATLQAALALSLKSEEDRAPPSSVAVVQKQAPQPQAQQLPSIVVDTEAIDDVYRNGEPYDIVPFHHIMWDATLTTDNDKDRWVGQGIHVQNHNDEDHVEGQAAATISTSMSTIPSDANETMDETTRLERLTQSHLPWGLVQQHGGPCGVLAAVQAEMLRTLLWKQSFEHSFLSRSNVLEALARAIGTILARAALTPGVVQDENNNFNTTTNSTNSCHEETAAAAGMLSEQLQPAASVKLVLPQQDDNNNRHDRPLTWDDFEPWSCPTSMAHTNDSTATMTSSTITTPHYHKSSSFTVYTIPTELPIVGSSNDRAKRQKVESSSIQDGNTMPLSSRPRELQDEVLFARIDHLAQLVEAFLLQAPAAGGGFPPIYHFRHAGGVLLLVMSLVATRTRATSDIGGIAAEFDDPSGTRLTAQFGHCGQELINLLLTGQAVSNVFDHTLRPSGDMICRGISRRPAIGYLSQLESLRYCQVGSYYKIPRAPIWVVGSTSHFSVLFGPLAALLETPSDLLLEQCRRAFKSVKGGEENGFIATHELPSVLSALDMHLGGESTDSNSQISLLSAMLEVNGAGIILWDDFWKAISRLLTGASLESVLQGGAACPPAAAAASAAVHPDTSSLPPPLIRLDGEDHALSTLAVSALAESPQPLASTTTTTTQGNASTSTTTTNTTTSSGTDTTTSLTQMETDEEMARRLANEWGWDTNSHNNDANSVDAVNGGSPVNLPSDADDEDEKAAMAAGATDDDEDIEDSKPAAKSSTAATLSSSPLDFETYGNTFPLYHYNGLRSGVLTPFRVTRLTPEEAVGASIALHRSQNASSSSSSGTDLEDVIRTKWPSCAVNWLGQSPPYID